MTAEYQIGDRVEVRLRVKSTENEEWLKGIIISIEPYSVHRSFHWVELDEESQLSAGIKQISVFNPKNIRKI